jgi:integrase
LLARDTSDVLDHFLGRRLRHFRSLSHRRPFEGYDEPENFQSQSVQFCLIGADPGQVGTKRPFTQKQIWAIRFFLDRERRVRDRALFDLAIDSKLRGCDLVKIRIRDLVAGPEVRTRSTIVQQKTRRPVQFEITADVRASLLAWLERRGGTVEDYAFPSRIDHTKHMSTRQYARLVDEWVTAVGLRPEEYGTHSLRRTKASMIYRATGNIRAIQILLGHSKIENTVRYLGVDVEDALLLAERTEI